MLSLVFVDLKLCGNLNMEQKKEEKRLRLFYFKKLCQEIPCTCSNATTPFLKLRNTANEMTRGHHTSCHRHNLIKVYFIRPFHLKGCMTYLFNSHGILSSDRVVHGLYHLWAGTSLSARQIPSSVLWLWNCTNLK